MHKAKQTIMQKAKQTGIYGVIIQVNILKPS